MFNWEWIRFQAHIVVGRILFLAGYWSEGLNSLQAVAWRQSLRALHGVAQNMAAGFQNEQTRQPQNVSKIEVTDFYNLILEVASLRSKPLTPAHAQGEEIKQRCKYQDTELIGSHLRNYHTGNFFCFLKIFKNFKALIWHHLQICADGTSLHSNEFIKPPLLIMRYSVSTILFIF